MLRRVGTKILGGRLRIRSNCCGCVRGRTQPACGSKSRAPGSAILLVLLAASCWSAFLPLGSYNTALNLVIAAIMLLVLAIFLMNLARASALLRLVASAGCSGSCSCLY